MHIALSGDKPATGSDTANPVKYLTSPYNLSHPDSRCENGRHHKMTTVTKVQTKPGIFAAESECRNCGARFKFTEDHNLLAGIFSTPLV